MKRLISSFLLFVFLLSSIMSLPVGAAPDGVKYQSKQITAYLYGKKDKKTVTCLFRDDLPAVPSVGAVDYLNQLYTVEFKCRKDSDSVYTVSNKYGEMVIDVDKDTIHFDDFDEFVGNDVRPILEDETADYLKGDSDYEIIGELKAIDLDLGAYGIDLTVYGDEVYFPLPAINDLFSGTYHCALYLDGALYFNDVMEDEPYYDTASLFKTVTRDKALVEYSYNELCFVMDRLYGSPAKSKLAELIAEKGFDQAISTYNTTTAKAKELLLSDSLIDYLYGLLYLDMYLDDGGHTVMSYGLQMDLESDSVFSKAFKKSMYDLTDNKLMPIQSYIMDQSEYMNDQALLLDLREAWLESMTEIKTWDDAAFYLDGVTGIFSFDEFKDAIVEPFKWSLDYAAEHGVENFVIDLSLNSGGSTAVVAYILSVVCENSRMDVINTLNGNQYSLTETVDKNLDGVFDAKDDEVKYDFNFAALTSRFSFSAANLLACMLKYYGVAAIGETSGGGSCAIAIHADPAGYVYALSDIVKMIVPDGGDVDSGAAPDVEMPGSLKNYEGFYQTDRISEGIVRYYENRPAPTEPAPSPDATEPTREVSPSLTSADYERAVPVLWVIFGATTLIFVAAFIIVLARSSRKRR